MLAWRGRVAMLLESRASLLILAVNDLNFCTRWFQVFIDWEFWATMAIEV